MIPLAVTDTDFQVAAVVAVIVAVLLYRLFRREPRDRIVRLGVFIERVRNGHAEPHNADTHDVVPDDETTRIEWPKREEAE